MTLHVELREILMLLVAFAGLVAGFGRLLLGQFERRLDERFTAQEKIRHEARSQYEQRFEMLEEANRQRERDHLELRAVLPIDYVRREDFVRNQSVIEAKLDALAVKIENVVLRGKNG